MPDIKPLCLTCLSNTTNGISMPSTITDFLQNILGFKFTLRENQPHNLVCLPCYRTLCEMKRFYVQLQDIEDYFSKEIKTINSESELLTQRKIEDGNTTISNNSNIKIRINETLDQEKINQINSNVESIKVLFEEEMAVEPVTENVINDLLYKCDNCFRVFDVHETYKKHLQWHISHRTTSEKSEREKKIGCEMCGKLFTTQTQKKTHEVTHTNLRPYKCSVCPKTFRHLSGLSVHRTIHFGKRVECPECCKRFSTKYDMLKHMKTHRKKWKGYQCNGCMKLFSNQDELQQHRLINKERFKCDVCNKMYCNEETLQAHVRIAHNMYDSAAIISNNIKDELRQSLVTENSLLIERLAEDIYE